jgi:hypothetical protein
MWKPFKSAVERAQEAVSPPPVRDVLDAAAANRLRLTIADSLSAAPLSLPAFLDYLAFHAKASDDPRLIAAQRAGELEAQADALLGEVVLGVRADPFRLARLLDLYAQYVWVALGDVRPRRAGNTPDSVAAPRPLKRLIDDVNACLAHDACVFRIEPDPVHHFTVHPLAGTASGRDGETRPSLQLIRSDDDS